MVGASRNQSMSIEMPRVNALVGVLADHDPAELRDLQARYPEYVQLLRPGTLMGKVDANTRVLVRLSSALSIWGGSWRQRMAGPYLAYEFATEIFCMSAKTPTCRKLQCDTGGPSVASREVGLRT